MAWENYNRDVRQHTLALGRAIKSGPCKSYVYLFLQILLPISIFCDYSLPCSFPYAVQRIVKGSDQVQSAVVRFSTV